MAPHSQTFCLVRRGNDPAQCEDACAADDALGRYAVADGATEGCFSRLWARLLVEAFVRDGGPAPEAWCDSLPAVQAQWDADVRSRVLRASAERGVRRGTFATFLGLVIENSPLPLGEGSGVRAPRRIQALAVGDTCLVHTRGGRLLHAFPLETAAQFGDHPDLVGSRTPREAVRQRQVLWTGGLSEPGDRLWAMTDALAVCCLTAQENGGRPWTELESLLSPDRFECWIESLRETGLLKNDDVTLLAIDL